MSLREVLKTARNHYGKEEFQETEKILKEAVKDKDGEAIKSYMAWVLLGAAQNKNSKIKEAESSYKTATQIDDSQLPAWQGLRDVHIAARETKDALQVLHRVWELSPEDQREKSISKVIELCYKYDNDKLSSLTVDNYITKEVQSRSTSSKLMKITQLGNATNQHKQLEKLDASASVIRDRVYSINKVDDILHNNLEMVLSELTPSISHSQIDWFVRRALNNCSISESWLIAAAGAIEHGLQQFLNGNKIGLHTLRSAVLLQDNDAGSDSSIPKELVLSSNHLQEVSYKLLPDDGGGDSPKNNTKRSRTVNISPEDIELFLRKKIAGCIVAKGRLAVILGLESSQEHIYTISDLMAAGDLSHHEDIADIKESFSLLEISSKEVPDSISTWVLMAAIAYRLNDLSNAILFSENGLVACQVRSSQKTITQQAVHLWSFRLCSIHSLASGLLGRAQKCVFPTVAVPGLCSQAITSQLELEKDPKIVIYEPKLTFDYYISSWSKYLKNEFTEALDYINTAIKTCSPKHPNFSYFLLRKSEILWKTNNVDECVEFANQALELNERLSRAYCLLAHAERVDEKRPDTDSVLYTKSEFIKCYGKTKEWSIAGTHQRRIDITDGKPYFSKEFDDVYGLDSKEWKISEKEQLLSESCKSKCISLYGKAIKYNPLDSEAGKALCYILLKDRKLEEAHEITKNICDAVEAAGERNAGSTIRSNLWVFKLRGFQCLEVGKNEEACECLRHSVRYDSDSGDTAYGLARAYEGASNYERAQIQYQKVLSSNTASDKVIMASQLGVASCLMLGTPMRLKDAGEILLSITSNYPKYQPGWMQLAKCRWKQALASTRTDEAESDERLGSLEEVIQTISQATEACRGMLSVTGECVNAYRLMGDVALSCAGILPKSRRTSYFDESTSAYQKAFDLLPDSSAEKAFAHYDLARALFTRFCDDASDDDLRSSAEQHCLCAIKILPKCPQFWTLLGCAMPNKLPNKRLYCITKSLQLDPKGWTAWCNQGWLLLLYGQVGPAKIAFQTAKQYAPENAWKPWLGLGLCHQRESFGAMTYDARNFIEQAYQASPLTTTAMYSLIAQHFYQPRRYGSIPEELGIRALAVKDAFASDPGALNTVGLVLEELGDYTKSLEAFLAAEDLLRSDLQKYDQYYAEHEQQKQHLEWISGRNGLLPVRCDESDNWCLCDAFTKNRMILTSQLRVLCKSGRGDSTEAKDCTKRLLEYIPEGDITYYESTTRAVLCSLIESGQYSQATSIADTFLEGCDAVTRDAVLAALSVQRCRQPDEMGAEEVLSHLPCTLIKDESLKRIAQLVEEAGCCLRNPHQSPDLTIARTIPERLLMYKVLLESGEGPNSIRYSDPSDDAYIEFRQTTTGEMYYTVNGDPRPVFKVAEMAKDDEGTYIEMIDIDKCVGLPTDPIHQRSIITKLLRMMSSAGVQYSILGDTRSGKMSTSKMHQQAALATSQLLSLVREVTSVGLKFKHGDIVDAVEVLYRFAGLISSLPEKIPDSVKDLPNLLHSAVALLSRVVSDGGTQADAVLFKAQYALSVLLYTAPNLFFGVELPWEDVVGNNDVDDEDDAVDISDQENEKQALEWITDLISPVASEGYAEAATLLGLTQYSLGQYEQAIETLTSTLEAGQALAWRRWDVNICLVACYVLVGDFTSAESVLHAAESTTHFQHIDTGRVFIEHRKLLSAGDSAAATAVIESALVTYPTSVSTLLCLVGNSFGTSSFDDVRKRVISALPEGCYVKRNLNSSLQSINIWKSLLKDPEGLPLLSNAKIQPTMKHQIDSVIKEWPSGIISKIIKLIMCIAVGEKAASERDLTLESIREILPGVDKSPLFHYWLSHIPGTAWDSFKILLQEIGVGYCNNDHLWFALSKTVETGLDKWPLLCPVIKPPDKNKLRGREYQEAFHRSEQLSKNRIVQVERLRGILNSCLDKMVSLRPNSPYVQIKRETLKHAKYG